MKNIRFESLSSISPAVLRKAAIALICGVASIPEGFVKVIEKLAFLEK